MKKLIAIAALVLSLLAVPLYSAEPEKPELNPEGWWNALWEGVYPTYDLYIRSVLMGGSLNFGGGFSVGAETPDFRFEGYLQGDYFMSPLGTEGTAAAMEIDLELGVSLGWKFLKFWNFDTYIACDIGYYMQLTSIYQNPAAGVFMGHNGIVLRPKYVTEFQIAKHYSMSIGIYYQVAILPDYSDYNGFGIMVSIL